MFIFLIGTYANAQVNMAGIKFGSKFSNGSYTTDSEGIVFGPKVNVGNEYVKFLADLDITRSDSTGLSQAFGRGLTSLETNLKGRVFSPVKVGAFTPFAESGINMHTTFFRGTGITKLNPVIGGGSKIGENFFTNYNYLVNSDGRRAHKVGAEYYFTNSGKFLPFSGFEYQREKIFVGGPPANTNGFKFYVGAGFNFE